MQVSEAINSGLATFGDPSFRRILSGGFSYFLGVCRPVEMPAPAADGLTYVTTATAAKLLRVAPCTISSWKAKAYLRPVPGSPPRHPVYLWDDVLEAEYTARQNAIRTSGTDRQVKRAGDRPVAWDA